MDLNRLLAHHSEFVGEDDIIVTADVDAFPMKTDIFTKVLGKDRRIWIFQYAHSLHHGTVFPLSFIGMRKAEWLKLIPEGTVSDLCNDEYLA